MGGGGGEAADGDLGGSNVRGSGNPFVQDGSGFGETNYKSLIFSDSPELQRVRNLFHDPDRMRCTLCDERIGSWSGHTMFVPHQARLGVVERVLTGMVGTPEKVVQRWWKNLDGDRHECRIPNWSPSIDPDDTSIFPYADPHSSDPSEMRRRQMFHLLKFLQDNGVLRHAMGLYNKELDQLGRSWEFERLEMIGDNIVKIVFFDRMNVLFPIQEGGISGKLHFVQQLVDSNEGLLRAFDYMRLDRIIGSSISNSKFKSDVVEALFGELQVYLWATEEEIGGGSGGAEADSGVSTGGEPMSAWPPSLALRYIRPLVEHVLLELTDTILMFQVGSTVRNAMPILTQHYRPMMAASGGIGGGPGSAHASYDAMAGGARSGAPAARKRQQEAQAAHLKRLVSAANPRYAMAPHLLNVTEPPKEAILGSRVRSMKTLLALCPGSPYFTATPVSSAVPSMGPPWAISTSGRAPPPPNPSAALMDAASLRLPAPSFNPFLHVNPVANSPPPPSSRVGASATLAAVSSTAMSKSVLAAFLSRAALLPTPPIEELAIPSLSRKPPHARLRLAGVPASPSDSHDAQVTSGRDRVVPVAATADDLLQTCVAWTSSNTTTTIMSRLTTAPSAAAVRNSRVEGELGGIVLRPSSAAIAGDGSRTTTSPWSPVYLYRSSTVVRLFLFPKKPVASSDAMNVTRASAAPTPAAVDANAVANEHDDPLSQNDNSFLSLHDVPIARSPDLLRLPLDDYASEASRRVTEASFMTSAAARRLLQACITADVQSHWKAEDRVICEPLRRAVTFAPVTTTEYDFSFDSLEALAAAIDEPQVASSTTMAMSVAPTMAGTASTCVSDIVVLSPPKSDEQEPEDKETLLATAKLAAAVDLTCPPMSRRLAVRSNSGAADASLLVAAIMCPVLQLASFQSPSPRPPSSFLFPGLTISAAGQLGHSGDDMDEEAPFLAAAESMLWEELALLPAQQGTERLM